MKYKNFERLKETAFEPFVFFPFFFGLVGLAMPTEKWQDLGYLYLPQYAFCSSLVCLGIVGYLIRWQQRDKPARWAYFIKACGLSFLALGAALLLYGSQTGFIFFVTELLHSRKEFKYHKLFTKSRRLKWK